MSSRPRRAITPAWRHPRTVTKVTLVAVVVLAVVVGLLGGYQQRPPYESVETGTPVDLGNMELVVESAEVRQTSIGWEVAVRGTAASQDDSGTLQVSPTQFALYDYDTSTEATPMGFGPAGRPVAGSLVSGLGPTPVEVLFTFDSDWQPGPDTELAMNAATMQWGDNSRLSLGSEEWYEVDPVLQWRLGPGTVVPLADDPDLPALD